MRQTVVSTISVCLLGKETIVKSKIPLFEGKVQMVNEFDYDKLSEKEQIRIVRMIKKDNLNRSDQYYPRPVKTSNFYEKYGKRIIDIAFSGMAIVVSLPINMIIGLITYFDVGRPLFFKQVRMGKDCRPFVMVKFRNMTNEKDENGVLLRADLRVTRWGRFVRSTSLDELLNFLNIFKGDMSIIGPRPLPEVYRGRFNKYHELRHSVKPGLDCPLDDPKKRMTWENRLNNDAWYAQNISFLTDLKMIWLLAQETLFGKGKEARGDGVNEGTFMGYFEDGSVMDSYHIPDKYIKDYVSEETKG